MNWSAKELAKRTGRTQVHGGRMVDPQPFLAWLDDWQARNPDETVARLARRAGSAPRSVWTMTKGRSTQVQLDVVDRFLVAAGEPPSVLNDLYPITDDHLYRLSKEAG